MTLELAAALIEVFEGCKLTAYRDSGGIWTIGIGHTKGAHEGQTITREEALKLFAEDQAALFKLVDGKPALEAAALVSFGFNCGAGALRDYLAGRIQLEDKVRDRKGNVLAGLAARRRLEAALIAYSRGGK